MQSWLGRGADDAQAVAGGAFLPAPYSGDEFLLCPKCLTRREMLPYGKVFRCPSCGYQEPRPESDKKLLNALVENALGQYLREAGWGPGPTMVQYLCRSCGHVYYYVGTAQYVGQNRGICIVCHQPGITQRGSYATYTQKL